VPWIIEHGPNFEVLARQLFANRVSAFFGLDVLVSAIVLLRFISVEGKRLAVVYSEFEKKRGKPLIGKKFRKQRAYCPL